MTSDQLPRLAQAADEARVTLRALIAKHKEKADA